MDEVIRELLDALESAEAAGAPLTDTVIREPLRDVIIQGFVLQEAGYQVPQDLLLNYTAKAEQQNSAVVGALERFIERGCRTAASLGLTTYDERESAFFDSETLSSSGELDVGAFFD